MKKIIFTFSIIISLLSITSCNQEEYELYTLATPVTLTLDEFRSSTEIMVPQRIQESGKIYAYGDYIFVNDKRKGIHVIDNSNLVAPQKIAFIRVLGNEDISIKNNYLYADSMMDLVVFDISNIHRIREVERLEDVFSNHIIWMDADSYDWSDYNYENQVIVDWNITVKRRLVEDELPVFFTDDIANIETNQKGTGGSLARFKIVSDYLYTVDSNRMHIFDIQDLDDPIKSGNVFVGFGIETIFNKDEYLFLGSSQGMYIYDISQADSPQYVSELQHRTACDPVVVDGNYAYITLRGGNFCGAFESSLQIVNISDISNPFLEETYPLDNPYGLGIKDEKLFICDGSSGLKVFDKSDISNLTQSNHFKDINAFDVIPLANSLLLIGENTLYQYRYTEENIELLSSFSLN